MGRAVRPLVLVVLAGPQAAGKSTVAAALADDLRRRGELVARVELDQIALMALPTLPNWDVARDIFEMVVEQWTHAELTCVIAEGVSNEAEVADLLRRVGGAVRSVTVVLTAPFDIAFARAGDDPTREASRDFGFLSGVYQQWEGEVTRIDADVLIDTGDTPVDQSVESIRAAVRAVRS